MDTYPPRPDDNLSDLERQLAAWKPSADGLDPERMIFAAGRASARAGAGRFVWPASTIGMALVAAVLGGLLVAKRSRDAPMIVEAAVEAPAVTQRAEEPREPIQPPEEHFSAPALERLGELADGQQRSLFYRRAGDLYLAYHQDVQSALRCYTISLNFAPEQSLVITPDDSWLLMSLKDSRLKEKRDVRNNG